MRSVSAGVPAINQAGCWSGGAVRELMDVIGNGTAQVLTGTADAISFPGTTIINSPGVNAATLALPLPGAQPAGDDGKTVEIFIATAFVHTVTTPANGINLTKHILTWSPAAVGGNIILQAWNGTWLIFGTEKGVTIT
jgi:hypothetical protein